MIGRARSLVCHRFIGSDMILKTVSVFILYNVAPSFRLTLVNLEAFSLLCVVVKSVCNPNQFNTSRASKIGMIRRPCLALSRLRLFWTIESPAQGWHT